MSAQDNEVNRDIDTQTAEGHRMVVLEETEEAGKRVAVRPSDGLDDEAEGHLRIV